VATYRRGCPSGVGPDADRATRWESRKALRKPVAAPAADVDGQDDEADGIAGPSDDEIARFLDQNGTSRFWEIALPAGEPVGQVLTADEPDRESTDEPDQARDDLDQDQGEPDDVPGRSGTGPRDHHRLRRPRIRIPARRARRDRRLARRARRDRLADRPVERGPPVNSTMVVAAVVAAAGLLAVTSWRRRARWWAAGWSGVAGVAGWVLYTWATTLVVTVAAVVAVLALVVALHRRARTVGTVTRWGDRARRKKGVASTWDVVKTASALAMRRKSAVVRPSLPPALWKNWRQVWRRRLWRVWLATPVTEFAVRLARVGALIGLAIVVTVAIGLTGSDHAGYATQVHSRRNQLFKVTVP
jgi:uncharacterized membrane protein